MTDACLAPASRCARAPAGPRWRRAVGGCLAGLALAAVLAGCATLGDALSASGALGRAGYGDASVNVESGTGLPAGGLVEVSYTSGPAGGDEEVAARAERIVWDSYARRFGAVAIVKVSGGCTGPVCDTESRQIADATYSQLSSEFGPQPRGLHGAGLLSEAGLSVWDLVAVAILVPVIAIAVAVRHHRRRRGPPSWPGGPGNPGSWPQPRQQGP